MKTVLYLYRKKSFNWERFAWNINKSFNPICTNAFRLLISLGVSQFLSQPDNAEKYRFTFVHHEGKMELMVDGGPLGLVPRGPNANITNKVAWPKCVDAIVELIKENTKNDTTEVTDSYPRLIKLFGYFWEGVDIVTSPN